MKTVYYIKYPNDVHWLKLVKLVGDRHMEKHGSGIMTPLVKYSDYNEVLAPYNGRYIVVSLRDQYEFDYLEFDSEEDLVVFKLTFC